MSFWLSSELVPYLRFSVFISVTFVTFLDPLVNRFRRQTLSTVNMKHFFMNILCIETFCSQGNAEYDAALRWNNSQARSPFLLLKPASECAHAHLLRRLSWICSVLLPSDTKTLLRPLQLFYFHLWPIYRFHLVVRNESEIKELSFGQDLSCGIS
jgi:hypothetical protein